MNSFESYKLYIAIKSHFTTVKYDFFKFKGNIKALPNSLEYRNDKFFFEKILNKYPTKERLVGFYVSAFIKNPNFWIGEFDDRAYKKNYQKWLGKVESLGYYFIQDLQKVKISSEESGIDFCDFFKIDSGETESRFLEMVLDGYVTLETYTIMDKLLGLENYYKNKIIDPLYDDFALKVKKYSPFIKIDRNEFSEKFKSIVNSSN